MSLLLLFLSSEEAATDDFCNLLQENGGKLLTEAGADIVGENCAATLPVTADTGGRPRSTFVLIWADDEEALFASGTL